MASSKKNYSTDLTNNERGVILEDVYTDQMAKVIIPTLNPSLEYDEPYKKKVNAPTGSNIVSGVNLGLAKYKKQNYIELQSPQKFYKGDLVTVSTINEYLVEDMTLTGEYYE
jgi:hypothetical protein